VPPYLSAVVSVGGAVVVEVLVVVFVVVEVVVVVVVVVSSPPQLPMTSIDRRKNVRIRNNLFFIVFKLSLY